MYRSPQRRYRRLRILGALVLLATVLTPIGSGQAAQAAPQMMPKFTEAAAFDTSPPLRELASAAGAAKRSSTVATASRNVDEVRPDRGPAVADRGHSADGAIQ